MANAQGDDLSTSTFSKMKEVEETFNELQQAGVPNISVSDIVNNENIDSELYPDLLSAKFNRLKAEISVVKESPVSLVPENEEVQFEIFTQELEKDILELQETYSFVCGQHKDLDSMVAKEEEIVEQSSCVSDMLQKRLSQQENRQEQDRSSDAQKETIYKKIQNGDKYLKVVLKKLGSFVDTHFPLPSPEVFSEQTKKLRSADQKLKLKDMISLKQIIQELMNKCIEEPSDPYVVTDHRFWPPYIELLLRCQIALRHPDNKDKIKLVPFYL